MSIDADFELIALLDALKNRLELHITRKRYGTSGSKIGNAHLKWAFSEAAVLFLRGNPEGMKFKKRFERKHGRGKALSILAHRPGRSVYYSALETHGPILLVRLSDGRVKLHLSQFPTGRAENTCRLTAEAEEDCEMFNSAGSTLAEYIRDLAI